MGSPTQVESADNFGDAKDRINRAFEHLREEMKEIQRQDIFLLNQLMHIRHTILLLTRHGDRRSCSISALDPSAQDIVVARPDVTSSYFRRRPCLSRVQSAPLESCVSEEAIPEEDEEDELAQSFNSTVSESCRLSSRAPEELTNRLSRPEPDTDFIYAMGPLPPVFKRLMTSLSPSQHPVPSYACALDPTYDTEHAQSLAADVTSFETSAKLQERASSQDSSSNLSSVKRRKLQRQRSVEETDAIGHAVIENLQRMNSHGSIQVEIQV